MHFVSFTVRGEVFGVTFYLGNPYRSCVKLLQPTLYLPRKFLCRIYLFPCGTLYSKDIKDIWYIILVHDFLVHQMILVVP